MSDELIDREDARPDVLFAVPSGELELMEANAMKMITRRTK